MSDKKKKIKKKIIKSKSKLPKLNTTGTEGDDSNNQNRLRFGGAGDIRIIDPRQTSITFGPTGHIAYRLNRNQLEEILLKTNEHTAVINDLIDSVDNSYDESNDLHVYIKDNFFNEDDDSYVHINEESLLGVLFEFRNTQGQEFENIEVFQLFYANNKLIRYPHQEPLLELGNPGSGTDFNIIETQRHSSGGRGIEKTYSLRGTDDNFMRPIGHQLPLPSNSNWIEEGDENKYKRLHFFNEQILDVGFVFFTKDQLDVLYEFFDSYVITGIQMDLGLKVGSMDPNKVLVDHYFNLKIEGEIPRFVLSNFMISDESEAYVPGIMVGIPCPDVWFAFGGILPELKKIAPKEKVRDLAKLLMDFIAPSPDEN